MRARPLTIDGLRELRSRDDRFRVIGDVGPGSIEEAHSRAAGPAWVMPLAESTRRGFKVYRPADVIDQLLTSAATLEFRRLTKVKQTNRHQVIAAVLEILTDGVPLIVHRFDIRSFYESIPRSKVEARLNEDIGLPRTTIRVVRSLFRGCDAISLSGLPRGIGISAALSEDLLRPIDRAIRLHGGIYFSCRYVDDILLITGTDFSHADLKAWMGSLLWEHARLTLNNRKSLGVLVNGGSAANSPAVLDFLGYKLELLPKKNDYTEVVADIAESKVRKIKTKACLAALAYIQDRDESLLRDRLKALTANYVLPGDHPHHAPRVGIYYSYPRVTHHSYDSGALRGLDDFMRNLFLGKRTKLSCQIRSLLPGSTCSQFAKLSFVDGHFTRRLEHFDSRRIGKIVECWKHA